MKQLAIALFASLFFFSCHKNDAAAPAAERPSQRLCAADEAVQAQIAADPTLRQRLEQLELFTRNAIANNEIQRMSGTTIEIPVVVHVLYNTPEENISDAQIQSQIDVLNEDFNLRNADRSQVPSLFSGV